MQKSDEDTIVRRATELFRVHGYHHTSMSEVGEASGLLKGSLYHYFPGKEQLALSAIERVRTEFRATVFAQANAEGLSPSEHLRRVNEATRRYFEARDGGCLLGNLALETLGTVPRFREPIEAYFQEWIGTYESIYLAATRDPGRARKDAEEAVALVQGSLMMCRVFGSATPLRRVLDGLQERLDHRSMS